MTNNQPTDIAAALDRYDQADKIMRQTHDGSGDAFGHWGCACGKSGGGSGPNARDWHRGHNMHLRAEYRRILNGDQS